MRLPYLAAGFLVVLATLPQSPVAAATTGSVTLTASASSMTYGGSSPTYRSTLTMPSDDPPLALGATDVWHIQVGSNDLFGSASFSGAFPTYYMYVGGLPLLPAGKYSVVSEYQSPNHGLITSPTLTLTVNRAIPQLTCLGGTDNPGNNYAASAPLTIDTTLAGEGVDFQNGTFSMTFAGPRTYTYSGLKADASGNFVTHTPPVDGVYGMKCSFSGTANWTGNSYSFGSLIVTAGVPVAGIQLYTSPTPVTHGPTITWEVVVSGRPALPIPTGTVSLRIGANFTKNIGLSGGKVTFTAVAPYVSPTDLIEVFYSGDAEYGFASATFPLATRPIPAAPRPSPVPASSPPAKAPSLSPSATAAAPSTPSSAPASASASPTPSVVAQPVANHVGGIDSTPMVAGAASVTLLLLLAGLLAWRRRV